MELITLYNLSFTFGHEFTMLSLLRLCMSRHKGVPELILIPDFQLGLLKFSDTFQVQTAIVNLDGTPFLGKTLYAKAGPPPFYPRKYIYSCFPTNILYFKNLNLRELVFIRGLKGVITTNMNIKDEWLVVIKDSFLAWRIQKLFFEQRRRESTPNPIYFLEKNVSDII